MPLTDSWDWELLIYTATVVLKRSEKQFWTMTPRKLNALTHIHTKMNGGDKDKKQPKTGYIDQVL